MKSLSDKRAGRARALFAALLLACLSGALTVGAGSRARQGAAKARYSATGEEARIAGVVGVEGEVPRTRDISMDADPVCAAEYRGYPRLDDLVVRDGRLANAFVYVRGAPLERLEFESPQEPAVLDRRKCRTVPHVLGVQAGQTVRVINGDKTAHNYNFSATKNRGFNRSLAPSSEDSALKFFELKFDEPEMPVLVRCNQHPWERGYMMVMPNPFFAVTDRNGAFTIEGLPPGDYEVVLWHERLRGRAAKVSLGRREFRDVNFTLKLPEDDTQLPAPKP